MLHSSQRKYRIITVCHLNLALIVEDFEASIQTIAESSAEVFCALQEQADEVLDIPVGCSLSFNPTRGSRADKGIIIRLK